MSRGIQDIERLREIRGRRQPAWEIDGLVASMAKHATRTQKKLGELAELWEQLVPAALIKQTALAGYHAGVLHVTADGSACAFELDRRLRGGLLEEMRSKFRGTLVRVRVRVGGEETPKR